MFEARTCEVRVACGLSSVASSDYDGIEMEGGYKIDLLVEVA